MLYLKFNLNMDMYKKRCTYQNIYSHLIHVKCCQSSVLNYLAIHHHINVMQ